MGLAKGNDDMFATDQEPYELGLDAASLPRRRDTASVEEENQRLKEENAALRHTTADLGRGVADLTRVVFEAHAILRRALGTLGVTDFDLIEGMKPGHADNE